MKYRLVELLQCPGCQGDLRLSVSETRPGADTRGASFPCRRYCALDDTTNLPDQGRCSVCWQKEIVAGTLTCRICEREFGIVQEVPWLFEQVGDDQGRKFRDTVGLYSHLWRSVEPEQVSAQTHMEHVQEALGEPVVQGSLGLDAGSGCGPDTASMARRYPSVEILSLDISEGVYRTKHATAMLPNVHVIRASILALPLRPGLCDFGYSFGVLHHTTDPQRGLQEIVRVLKANARVTLYLYEDHADNPWKAAPLKAVTALRQLTTKLQPRILSALCYLLSPFVVVAFSIPARVLSRFGPTRALADQMPFNFGTSLFSVQGDLVDRFGAPIEIRYSRDGVIALLQTCGLTEIRTTRLRTSAGWVARGVTRSQ